MNKRSRQSNLEMLRIISMLMIMIYHMGLHCDINNIRGVVIYFQKLF